MSGQVGVPLSTHQPISTMKTITVCNQKGGAGKSTTTMLLAMAIAAAGRRVAVRDYDTKQKTATNWVNLITPEHANLFLYDPNESYDFVFNDTPPVLDDNLAGIIKDSDLVVIVTAPSPVEIMSAKVSVDFVDRSIKKGASKLLLFRSVDTRTGLGRSLDEMSVMMGMPRMRTSIPDYQAYKRAALQGWPGLKRHERDAIVAVALELVATAI